MKQGVLIGAAGLAASILGLGLGHSLGSAERGADASVELRSAQEEIRRLQDRLAGAAAVPSASSAESNAPLDVGGAIGDAQARLEAATKKLAQLESESRAALAKADAKADALQAEAKQRADAAQAELQRAKTEAKAELQRANAEAKAEFERAHASALASKDQALKDAQAESAKLREEVRALREEVRKLNERIGTFEKLQKVKLPSGW